MARRRIFRRGGSLRRAIPLRWTGEGTTAANTTAAGAITTSEIVATTDYEQSSTLEEGGVTLVRLRGWFGCYCTTIGAICAVHIVAIDASEDVSSGSSNSPLSLEGDLRNGQVLWRWGTILAPVNDSKMVEFDIKAKRRLQDTRIMLVVASFVQTTTWTYSARALLRGG